MLYAAFNECHQLTPKTTFFSEGRKENSLIENEKEQTKNTLKLPSNHQ
jgi:hypothetical protein